MKKIQLALLAVAGLVAASTTTVQAQPYFIVGDVVNGWSDPGAIPMNDGPTTYDYPVTGGTAGNFEALKVTTGTWSTTWPGNNLVIRLDANGGNTVYFYPGTFTDGWQPVQNRVGFADPLTDSYEIAGDFTTPNWDTDPNAQLIAAGNGVYTNTYVIATAGVHNFKMRSHGTWGGLNAGNDFGGADNATVTTTNANQPVFFQLDLPNGRWLAGNVVPPVTNEVVFAVDMTAQIQLGNFNPSADLVYVSGVFNNWPGTGAGALVLTNYPAYNGGSNTNIYYATNSFIGAASSSGTQYKFTASSIAYSGAGGYEPTSANRTFTLLATSGTLPLAVVKFGDVNVSDYLTGPVTVTFSVNMTNAMSYPDGHVFDPSTDSVFINGNFIPGGWSAWNPIALNQMVNDPVGSEIYTFTAVVDAASLDKLDYKYGMYYAAATNYDNEAAAYNDHFRYIRTTATGAYTLPLDQFGNQYVEPNFGQLTAAGATPGSVAVSWLGRPGIQLQTTTNLTEGNWQTLAETDGTNWVTGNLTPSGYVSQTNCPAAGGRQFFRLFQAW